MVSLKDDILQFLKEKGFHCTDEVKALHVAVPDRWIVPVDISASTREEADIKAEASAGIIQDIRHRSGQNPLIISEDWWRRDAEIMKKRLLAHLGRHFQIYARNCEIRRIDKSEASEFLSKAHSYGDASCRHRYGLFLKRHTGHMAEQDKGTYESGCLVAVATFSNARKWIKGDKAIRSYEWTRYASLPGIRVNGGMGKLLKAFIEDIEPDDIMSYADLEWSEGDVYEKLGFSLDGHKDPVYFTIDRQTWERKAVRDSEEVGATGDIYFRNFGSAKYRLKLTEYE